MRNVTSKEEFIAYAKTLIWIAVVGFAFCGLFTWAFR
jgi:hypothetical protein